MPKKLIYYIDQLSELYRANKLDDAKTMVLELQKRFPTEHAIDYFANLVFKTENKTSEELSYFEKNKFMFYTAFFNMRNAGTTGFKTKKTFLNELKNSNLVIENLDLFTSNLYFQIGIALLEQVRTNTFSADKIKVLKTGGFSDKELSLIVSSLHKIASSWYYEDTDLASLIAVLKNSIEGKNIIDKLSLRNYFSIKNIELTDLKTTKEIYFLGENGDGKTILLQAILLALKGNQGNEKIFPFVKENDEFQERYGIPALELRAETTNQLQYHFNSNYKKQQTEFINIYAYGVNRLRKSENEPDKSGYATLFDADVYLTSPEQWLKDIQLNYYRFKEIPDLEKAKDYQAPISPNQAIQLLEQVINFESGENKLEVTMDGTTIHFIEKGTPLRFEQLSDGYKSILILLSDLLSRLSANQPFISDATDYTGIVLIDELGVYLHPKWEYSITGLLRKLFPNIQWIFSTHSPVIVFGASKDAIFYKLYKENGETKVSEAYSMAAFSNKLINGFVSSPLFNLPSSKPSAYQKSEHDFETGNYIYDIIHKEVKKRLNQKPLQNNEIKNMVTDLLDQFEKDGTL